MPPAGTCTEYTYTVHIYIYTHICTWLATQVTVRYSEDPHKLSQHQWPHPAPLSGCAGWKSTGNDTRVQGGSRTPSPASGKPSPCTNLAGEAVTLGAGRMRRLSQLASHRTWLLELSSLELVPVAGPGWKGNCIKLFNDENEAAGRRRAMPQPLPPTEQGKPPQRQHSQPGGGEPRPPPASAAPTRGQPLQTALVEGGPHTK